MLDWRWYTWLGMHKAKSFYLVFEGAEEVAPSIQSFYFSTNEAFDFTAGQYLQLTIPHKNVDDRGTSRFFSIASSPSEKKIMITTKVASNRKALSSFKKAMTSLQKGQTVEAFGPMGKFVLPN